MGKAAMQRPKTGKVKKSKPKAYPDEFQDKPRPKRPQTAKPMKESSREKFLDDKLKMLEELDLKLEKDLEAFMQLKPSHHPKKKDEKGIDTTADMILASAHCDELEDVKGILLRDQGIGTFKGSPNLAIDELTSVEFINLSHNLLSNVDGISTISTLQELNLNFNKINDIQ